jgi:tetratricopeptide (TPR) repeat protein
MKLAKWFSILLLSLIVQAQQPATNLARVEVPGVPGVLEIDVGASPWHLDFLPEDKWTMLQANQRPDHVIVNALLRQAQFAATAQSCKNEMWSKVQQSLGAKIQNLQENFTGGFAREEFTMSEEGTPVRQLYAYLGSRDLCVQVNLSKANFSPDDQKAFEQILASVRLLPDQSGIKAAAQTQETSSSLMAQGDEAREQSNYAAAARSYERAFALEKATRTFPDDMFLDLISRLGFAYRMNGNLAKAKDTLDYGLAQNSDYPIFHYDMACVYAQMGDVDQSVGHLRTAYQHRAKVAPTQLPAYPAEDGCFSKIANDPRFVDAVQKLQLP